MHPAKSNILKNSALLVVSVCICLALIEAVCRFAYPNWPGFAPQHFLFYDNQLGTYQGRPGFSGQLASAHDEFSVSLSLDAAGYRNPPSRSPQTAGIWVAGDSFAFGWGVEQNETFAARLAEQRGTDVYNFALPATDLSDYLKILTPHKDIAAGKILIVSITLENDILDYRAAPATSSTRNIGATAMTWGIRYSAFINVLVARLRHNPTAAAFARRIGLMTPNQSSTAPLEISIPASIAVLEKIRDLSAFSDVLVLLVPPRPAMHSDDRLERFTREASNAGFTLVAPTVDRSEFFPLDGHWTPRTHEHAATLLSAALAKTKNRPVN
jgi:hypothetical protein